MILDRESKTMLDNLISGEPDYARGTFSYEYICEQFHMDSDDVLRIAKELEKKGLVEYARWSSGPSMGVLLTQAGKAYREINRLESKERWKERIIGFTFGVLSAVSIAVILELASL